MPQPSQSWYHPGMPQLAPNVGMIHPNQHGPQVFVPAENTTSIVQIDDEGVDEPRTSAAAKAKGKKPKVVTRVKLSNFSMEEDRNLVTSWLEISNDAITCNAQKKDGMWLKILGRYELRRGSYPERSMKSLQSRWDCIKAESGKFASCYADVVRENPSGMTDADKTTAAASDFAGLYNHNFPYLYCWDILKDEPKFQDIVSKGVPKSAVGDGFAEDSSAPTEQGENRPMGRDRAKALKKKEKSDAGSTSSEYASRMQDLSLQRNSIMQEESEHRRIRFDQMRSHHESLLLVEQERLRLERERHELEREEKEKQEIERILAIDLDVCNPAQHVYYKAKQDEILENIRAKRRNRDDPAR
ncbi:hypothetical protein HU200_026840 [Digitaria exilis]|uniref:No apical meristem-associated C-terminal domain-containing protein n=1 Tax=Digitaria exilis TaxID=1010633 RepID=A0A835BYV9_9POAL|nr:hypothetical protein HU200_026840 [Digitaria exilis]